MWTKSAITSLWVVSVCASDLQEHVGQRFDPTSPDFTLASVVGLRLDTHVDFIAELSVNATKELAIENNIKVRTQKASST